MFKFFAFLLQIIWGVVASIVFMVAFPKDWFPLVLIFIIYTTLADIVWTASRE